MVERYGVSKFKVEIELDNGAARIRSGLVELIETELLPRIKEEGRVGSLIRDARGHSVGRWRLILSPRKRKEWGLQ